jgi:hypothetical protein
MPTPNEAFDAVAEIVGGVPQGDARAVDDFYENRFPKLPEGVRRTISDWIVTCDHVPDAMALQELRVAVEQARGRNYDDSDAAARDLNVVPTKPLYVPRRRHVYAARRSRLQTFFAVLFEAASVDNWSRPLVRVAAWTVAVLLVSGVGIAVIDIAGAKILPIGFLAAIRKLF